MRVSPLWGVCICLDTLSVDSEFSGGKILEGLSQEEATPRALVATASISCSFLKFIWSRGCLSGLDGGRRPETTGL